MRIFYYFLERSTPMSQWQKTHFFDELSHHGVEIDVFNPLRYLSFELMERDFFSRIRSSHYDLFFTDQCNERSLPKSILDTVRHLGIPSLTIRFDNLSIPYNDRSLASSFDLVWLTSKETKHLYDKWGANTLFAPYAANPYTFSYTNPNVFFNRVCFIGTPYGSRSIMINNLTSKSIDVDVYYLKKEKDLFYNNYQEEILLPLSSNSRLKEYLNRMRFPQGRKILVGSLLNKLLGETSINASKYMHGMPVVKPDEQSSIYSNYILSLASTSTNHTDVLKTPLRIINLRNFEIPMSGGIEICKYNPELAEYFVEDKEILFYSENDELVDKARYYTQKASCSVINSLKLAARKKAENEHTWWHRFSRVFDELGLKY